MASIVTDSAISAQTWVARCGGRAELAQALRESRERTLQGLQAWAQALGPDCRVPYAPELNPPLWEAGHVGWFADWWIARYAQRHRGVEADPDAPRASARQSARGVDADTLYDSSRVAHARRWQLSLPDCKAVQEDLLASLEDTLHALDAAVADDRGLYVFRLALLHEDMHAEAAAYMAQTLGIDWPLPAHMPPCRAAAPPQTELFVPGQVVQLAWQGPGFAFDNELADTLQTVPPFRIDADAVSCARFLPFVETGGYRERRYWSEAGWAWVQAQGRHAPRDWRRHAGQWQVRLGSTWQALDPLAAVCHLSQYEAEAWCRWVGRRLPTEAEWVCAAVTLPDTFVWGQVWEWTASPFMPFDGFAPHPYRDYSRPWFDGRPVLKGASRATHPRLRHPLYRNYFTPERCDVFVGFRSVASVD